MLWIALTKTWVIVRISIWDPIPRKELGLPSSQKLQMMNLLTGGQKLCADCHVLIWRWEFERPTRKGWLSKRHVAI